MEQVKQERAAEEARNREKGTPGDVDFQRMIRNYRDKDAPAIQPHMRNTGDDKICICVRKRPISSKEIKKHDYDSVTCLNPVVVVHDCKLKVDGISKYLDNNSFEFDHSFNEDDSTDLIYRSSIEPLIDFVLAQGGRATVFAYGQTGSGKTYTMQGIQNLAARDLFASIDKGVVRQNQSVKVLISFFEIYGGRCQDLLNNRQKLNVREDGNGEVVVSDLLEMEADSEDSLHAIIETGNRNRTTHATESNDVSSRSHAICQICIRGERDQLLGRLSLIDLAGSERGADTKSHNRQRRMEGSEINKSLLALKECIRALDSGSSHVPYRGSKLTLVLKDSFTNKKSRTVMIANISPAASSADHTINTLRYADRIKERVVGGQAARNAALLAADPSLAIDEPKQQGSSAAQAKQAQSRPSQQDKKQQPPTSMLPSNGRAAGAGGGGAGGRAQAHNDFGEYSDEEEVEVVDAFHKTVQDLFEEEEDLLNLHMSIIQENAELLTEEGRLLQQIQGENNDIDDYALRLDRILSRKQELIDVLKDKLIHFRQSLIREENESKRLADMENHHKRR